MRQRINVSQVLAHKGTEIPIKQTYDLDEIKIGEDAYPVSTPVDINLVLRNVGKDLLLTGTLKTVITTECSRCLDPAIVTLEVDVEELIAREPQPGEEPLFEGEFPDTYSLEKDELDLEPIVVQSLLLATPLTPLCKEECKGLCPNCGTNWNEAACDCSQDVIDSRWEALRGLLDNQS